MPRCPSAVRTFGLAVAGAAVLGVAAPAVAPAQSKPRTVVTVGSSTTQPVEMCGATRAARAVRGGTTITVRARRRGAIFRGALVTERCENGRWTARTRIGRGTVRTTVPADADLRVRVLGARPQTVGFVRAGVGEIVDVPFTANVVNQNRTVSPCAPGAPDGGTYPIRGHLTAARSSLQGTPSATLLYHGLSYGEFFWRYRGVPGYDTTTELARAGRVLVSVDRLGYGASSGPDGNAICYGGHADIAKQLVDALKAGTYSLDGDDPLKFGRVALVGHSAGAFIAEITAYSFPGIDALGMLSYGDAGNSGLATGALGTASLQCLGGGEPQDADGPGSYAFFGATEADFQQAHLNAPTDPAVREMVTAMRTRDPCGDFLSIGPALVVNQGGAQQVKGPVLVMAGEDDALFPPPTVDIQQLRMSAGGASVVAKTLPRTGHAITLGETAAQFRTELNAWLVDNGF